MASHDGDYENCLVFRQSTKNSFEPAPAQKVKMMHSSNYDGSLISIVLNATTMWLIHTDAVNSATQLITLEKGCIDVLSLITKVTAILRSLLYFWSDLRIQVFLKF